VVAAYPVKNIETLKMLGEAIIADMVTEKRLDKII
jgi:hypothetical protein